MLIAMQEMRRLVGRFVLLTGAIALLVILLVFFQSVGNSLTTGTTGGVNQNIADIFVYSDKARLNPSASFMTTNAVDAVSKIDGVGRAAGVALSSFSPEGSDSIVSVVGMEDFTFGGPRELSEGRAPTQRGEALASNPSLSASDLTLAVGDSVTLEGVELTVVGLAKDATFSASPTVYVAFDDLQQMSATRAGTDIPPLLSWVAVGVADGADPATVAKAITDGATFDPAAAFAGMTPGGPPGGPPAGIDGPPPGVGDSVPPSTVTSSPADTTSTESTESTAPTTPSTGPTSQPATTQPPETQPPATQPPATQPPATQPPATLDPESTSVPSTGPAPATTPQTSVPPGPPGGSGGPPGDVGGPGGPPPGVADIAQALSGLSGRVEAVDRSTAAANLPGVGQISQSFGILNLLLYIVITIVTGVFFLILTVQKQDSLVLMRAMGASKNDVVKPVLLEVLVVVGIGSLAGVAIAGSMLYLLRNALGATMSPTTTAASVVAILVLGILSSIGAVRRVLSVNPVQAARTSGE